MILIVDDDMEMADTCAMFLETQGFDVSVASSGIEALSRIGAAQHELVIVDWAMPEMSGVQLSEKLKSDPSTAHLPILLMSASSRCDIAPSRGYDAFLRKPFLAEHLLAEVRQLLTGASAACQTCAGV